MKNIPVAEIIDEIKSDIAQKGYMTSTVSFKKSYINTSDFFNEDVLNQNLSEITNLWPVDMAPEVSGGRIPKFLKRLIRKLVRPSFYGSMKKQERFNCHTTIIISEMNKKINELERHISVLEGNR